MKREQEETQERNYYKWSHQHKQKTDPPIHITYYYLELPENWCITTPMAVTPWKLLAVGAPPRAAVVEVGAPVAVVAVLHVVAVWLLSEGAQPLGGLEVVGAVHHLDVLEVARLAEPFLREVPAAHLRRGVHAVWLRVHHLPTPLDHRSAVRQVREEKGRPVAEHVILAELHPPVALLWVLHS